MKQTILILHGWRLYGAKYYDLRQILEKNNFIVYTPDFPGFGSEPLISSEMTIDDYVLFLDSFYKKHHITKATLIGHSFGGRIAAKFAEKFPEKIEKLIFTGAPLVKQSLSLKKKIMRLIARKGKKTLEKFPQVIQRFIQKGTYRFIGEWDYYKSNDLKQVFKNVIREDASVYLHKISSPTFVLWGANDTIVPQKYGEEIAALIPSAKFASIQGAGHSVIYSFPKEFAKLVIQFLKQ